MNFSGPVLLVAGPLVGALVTMLVCRWRRVVALTGAIVAWLLWAMITAVPLSPTPIEQASRLFSGDTWLVFGRSLVLSEGVQGLMLFLYAGTSLLFLLSLAFPQSRHFVPGSLAVLSPMAAALMIRPFTFGALFLLLSVAAMVVVIKSERAGATQAALRYLIIAVLAAPVFLTAGWMLAGGYGTLLLPASRLLLMGFVVLLAGFPFYIWVTPIVRQSSPLAMVFVLGPAQLGMMAFVFGVLRTNLWLLQDEQWWRLLYWSGVGTVLAAGLLAVSAADFSRLVGGLLLLDMGMGIVTLGMVDGWQTAVSLQAARFVGLLLIAVGWVGWRGNGRDDSFTANRGLGRYAPFSVTLFVYGCLSLLGLPLTVGFNGRWAIITTTPQLFSTPALPYLLSLALLGGVYGLLRGLVVLLDKPEDETLAPVSEQRWVQGLMTFMLVVSLWIAIFPQALFAYTDRLANLFK